MFKFNPCIIYQCNKYFKFGSYIMLLRHLDIVATLGMTSALINRSKERQRAKNVLLNKLTDVINNSMSIKIGERSHNVASISKKSKGCDVTYVNSVVCRLASQGVTF
jgi:hypothetical protein